MRFSLGKNLRQFETKTIFKDNFFSNSLHFHTDWVAIATKPKPNSRIFRIWFTGTKPFFLDPKLILTFLYQLKNIDCFSEIDEI
jgi:hypothetical protein